MTRYADRVQVLRAHAAILAATGGIPGIRDSGLLDSAVATPAMTWANEDLYPSVPAKAGALAFSLIANHPFLDGNKRIGYVMAVHFLQTNGWELRCGIDEMEQVILSVAAGTMDRDELIERFTRHSHER